MLSLHVWRSNLVYKRAYSVGRLTVLSLLFGRFFQEIIIQCMLRYVFLHVSVGISLNKW